ncbi:PT domain-containing protein [Streptomyces massasporeus]
MPSDGPTAPTARPSDRPTVLRPSDGPTARPSDGPTARPSDGPAAQPRRVARRHGVTRAGEPHPVPRNGRLGDPVRFRLCPRRPAR